ncbi:MAG: 3-hydroxyacyl-CoA dehydrogenase family protein [Pseudomonadota bacterium]
MSKSNPKTAVLGAGTMGHGIAQVLALAGHQVRLFDPQPEAHEKARQAIAKSLSLLLELGLHTADKARACVERIAYHTDLASACSDASLVIETAPEDMELKRRLYASVEALVTPEAIICSNTSALSITDLARDLAYPGRFAGAHFWNPPQIIPCVEVIKGARTSNQTFERVVEIMREAGKEPVRVLKDVPGFLGNRMQHALQREALSLVEQGVASAEDVDNVVQHGFGLRLALMGPMERADLGGLDTTLKVQKYLLPYLDCRPTASPLLERQVEAGRLGLKTGAGFFEWPSDKTARIVSQRDRALLSIIMLKRELPKP